MTALIRRELPEASAGAVNRAMRWLGLQGVRRATKMQRSVESAQYTSVRFSESLVLEGITPSIGSVGDAYDNALMESIIGLYKTECIRTTVFHADPFRTVIDVEYATAGWVDWYNNRRLHSTLGMVSPVEYENAHCRAHQPV